MALGTLGSTLNDELNRLANGGTYRDMNQMVDEALAAKQWANRENINPYSTDTVGILNEIAGLGLDKRNWLDFNGVCNYIAGTTGLPAAAALRQVYPTTDLLTGVASYYVDATAPTNWGSLGYVYLNGVTGNFLSTPDSSALDITGDIDIRVQVALDNWTPSTLNTLVAKWHTATSTSYSLYLRNTGKLAIVASSNGTTTVDSSATTESSVVTGIANGATKWVRATLDVDNGSGGRTYRYYLSDDGTNWTQLGTDIVIGGGTITIFNSNAPATIGQEFTQLPSTGKFYRAQILNGIGGTTVLDVNIAADYKASNEDTFTATTGQTVTVNGVDTIANLGTAGSLLPTTLGSSTAADSNDPKFLDHTGTNYVYLPGVAGNRLSIPDAANLDTTDLDFRIRISLDSPTTTGNYASRLVSDPNRAWLFGYTGGTTAARMSLAWYPTGSAASAISVGGTVGYENSYTAGQSHWARVTLDVDNGAGGYVVKFFTAPDSTTVPTSWTQVGTTITGGTTTSLPNITSGIDISQSTAFLGKVFRAQLMDGIDGTAIVDIDTSVITAGSATSFTAVTGQTVTINRSTSGRKTVAVTQPTWLFGTDDYMEVNNRYMASGTYLYLPGVNSNFASTPDSAALDITGDIDIRCKVAMDDWTPSAIQYLIAKYGAAGQRSYGLSLGTNGRLTIVWSVAGTTVLAAESTAAPTVADGATLWVRATLDVDNGASGNDVKFYTSTDGTTWTQLGATVTQAGTTSIFNSTSVLEVGSVVGGTSNAARGKFFRAQVLNGIDGTVAFDANFETSITSLLQTSFTESSANAATVTINRSGSAYRSAGITTAGYLYPGATNTFAASATDFLNFGASDSFTLIAASRVFGASSANNERFLGKGTTTNVGSNGRYILRRTASANTANGFISDGTNQANPISTESIATGAQFTETFVINRSTQVATLYLNTSQSATASTSTVGSLANTASFGIGGVFAADPLNGEIYAAAVFRQALTASQIRQISNYFANREVYL
jgi:hypothetical protein